MSDGSGQAAPPRPGWRLAGRAARLCGHGMALWLRRVVGALVFVAVLAAAAVGGLAWRLAQGPLEIPWIAGQLEQRANANGGPNRLTIGRAALAWEGFRRGDDHPLDIRLDQVAVHDRAGTALVQAGSARITLSIAGLLQGRTLPREILLDGLALQLRRQADGQITLDLGAFDSPAQSQTESGGTLLQLLDEVSAPPQTDTGGRAGVFSQLRLVRIRNITGTLQDAVPLPGQRDTQWRLAMPSLTVLREARGGLVASAEIHVGAGARAVRIDASARMAAGSGRLLAELLVPEFVPATLADGAAFLSPLALVDAPVTLSGTVEMGRGLDAPLYRLSARVGPGRLAAPGGTVPLQEAALQARLSGPRLDLTLDRLRFGLPNAPSSLLQGRAGATRANGEIRLDAALTLDQLAFADLPGLWPKGVGGAPLREWLTENITAGTAQNGRLQIALTTPDDLSNPVLTAIDGRLEGRDVTTHWLRPVPPLERGQAVLTIRSPAELDIAVATARQANGGPPGAPALVLSNALVRITGLDGVDQYADIAGDVTGPVPDVIAVLRHPRIRILDRRPIEMRDPAGQMAGRVTITRLPLDSHVTVDDLKLRATARGTNIHLGGIAAGHDMDRGMLNLEADNDGLKVRGTADIANMAAQLQVDMDFRDGPPTQVVQKILVSGTPDVAGFAPVGLDGTDYLSGPVGVRAELTGRRNGRGEMLVRADFTPTRAEVSRLNWGKPPGRPATAEVRLSMERDRIAGIDRLTVTGDDLDIQATAEFAGGKPVRMRLQRAILGPGTDTTGVIAWPTGPKAPWLVQLDGASLDATSAFNSGAAGLARVRSARPDTDRPTDPWTLDARLRQVVLGDGRSVRNVFAHVENDGRITRAAELSGASAPHPRSPADLPGKFELSIVPKGATRQLTATATDAGAVLRALDVITTMLGGRLRLSASYDDTRPSRPLSGTAQISDFRIRDAPSVAKLLQGMSIYGLIDALRGPGLNFNELVAPFRMTGDTLELFDARAFSASLGATVKGRLDIARHVADMQGTIVPAYFFNSLLGRIPLLGRMLSPEQGGGVFAATFSVRGGLDDPDVAVNPLAAVTPGFLRGLFGVFDGPAIVPAPAK